MTRPTHRNAPVEGIELQFLHSGYPDTGPGLGKSGAVSVSYATRSRKELRSTRVWATPPVGSAPIDTWATSR